LNKSINCNIFK